MDRDRAGSTPHSRPGIWVCGSSSLRDSRASTGRIWYFGILPLTLDDEVEYDRLELGDILQLRDLHKQIRRDRQVEVRNATNGRIFTASHALSERQIEVLFAGGLIRWVRARL